MRIQYIDWAGKDPYANLALERYLLDNAQAGTCTLLLWQNDNTVVIGCNQNPWKECRTGLLKEEGVHLTRRFSGGGAVYHDLGNLNFSFICSEEIYDQEKQFRVIQTACKLAGIEATLSGRNDLQVGDKKFSGNAFFHQNGVACHHGTLLISSNYEKLSRYLTPSKAKLEGKGVDSVRSRVSNLQDLSPTLTVERMKLFLLDAFRTVYGLSPTPITLSEYALEKVDEITAFLRNPEWIYGKHAPASCTLECRYSWGGICVELDVKNGTITACSAYTDSLDWSLAQTIEDALISCQFSKAAILSSLRGKVADYMLADLTNLFEI